MGAVTARPEIKCSHCAAQLGWADALMAVQVCVGCASFLCPLHTRKRPGKGEGEGWGAEVLAGGCGVLAVGCGILSNNNAMLAGALTVHT